MTNQKHKKRILLVNRDVQFRYAGSAVVVGIVSTVLTAGLILYPLYQFEVLRIPRFLPLPMLALMSLAGVVNIALIGFMGVMVTHKLAGPMYALVRQFRSVEEGGQWQGGVKLRDGDDLRYVVRNFNGMMDAIRSQLVNDLKKIEDLEHILCSSQGPIEERLEQAKSGILTLKESVGLRLGKESVEHSLES